MRRAALLLLLLLGLGLPAAAQERVGVRTGNHPGFGRVVFDWTARVAYRVETQPGRVLLHFTEVDAIVLPRANRLPRNVLAVNRVPGAIELVTTEGARVRHFRNGTKVAVDLLDPAAIPATAPAATPMPSPPVASTEAPVRSTAQEAASAPAAPPPPVPVPPGAARLLPPLPERTVVAPPARGPSVPDVAAAAAPAPIAIARPSPARPVPPPLAQPAPTANPPLATLAGPPPIRARAVLRAGLPSVLRLPGTAELGIAALRRGDVALIVIASERAVELGAILADRAFAGAQVQRVSGASVITLPLPADHRLTVQRAGEDWLIMPGPRVPGGADVPFLRLAPEGEDLVLPAPGAAPVVTLTDAQSGLPLMVGTLRPEAARLPVTRSLPELDILETFHGAAVLARSDRVALRSGVERFILSGASSAMPAVAPEIETAAGMTRSFDFPAQPVPAMMERLRAQQAAVASMPPLQRGPARLAVAETLLALGLPQEAQSMLRMAGEEAPSALLDPRHGFLGGAAALLAGRTAAPGALDAELPVTDEVLFWRALRDATRGEVRPAAAAFAATAPLMMAYPDGLRRRLLPIVAETLASGGEAGAAMRLITQAGRDPALLLAHALAEDALGQADQALELFDAAAQSRDRLMRARALRHALERRLELGRITVAEAAAGLEQTLFAWRGDMQEVSTRERIAALRRDAGEPRAAMALLRETMALFPEQAPALRPALQAAFLHALASEPPLQAVALHDSQPELMPRGEDAVVVLEQLAERLVALDLAPRADVLLSRALERVPPGAARAALGERLARLRLEERDPTGALEALSASTARPLPAELAQRRAILAARAEAAGGAVPRAVAALAALGPAGDLPMADILAQVQEYGGAAVALARHLDRLPADGPLPGNAQREVVRLAALRILAGEEAMLPALRERFAPSVTEEPFVAALEALTTDPVRALADLPRVARELDLFRNLPLRTAQRSTN